MDDDVDIYGDLPSFEANECGKCKETSKKLSEKNADLEAESSVWKNKCEAFEEEKKTILTNTSSLMKTARAEIARKDKVISELRRELEDLKFKRGVWSGAKTKRFAPKDLRKPLAVKQNVEALPIKTISTTPVNEERVGKTYSDHDYEEPEQKWGPNRQNVTLYGERLRRKIWLEEEAERVRRRKARSPVFVAQPTPTEGPGAPAAAKGNKEDLPTITRQAAANKPPPAAMSEEEEGEWVDEKCQQRNGSVEDKSVENKIKPVRDSERMGEKKEREEPTLVGYVVKSEYWTDDLYENVSVEDYESGELVDDLRDDEPSEFQRERHRKADVNNCNANFKSSLHYKLTTKSSHDTLSRVPGESCAQSDHDRKSHRHKSHRPRLVHEQRSKSDYRSHSKTPDRRINDAEEHERRSAKKRKRRSDKYESRRKDVRDKYDSKDHCNKDNYDFRDWHKPRGEDKSDERSGYDNYRNYNSDDRGASKSRSPGEKSRNGSDAAGLLNERRGIKRLRSQRHHVRPENEEKSNNRRYAKMRGRKLRKIEAYERDAVGKRQKSESLGGNSVEETARKERKVSRTRRKRTCAHETERDLIDGDDVATDAFDQVEARDKCILMLENEEVPLSPLIRPENQPAGSYSFREEKIENIEKFIQDYQYDEARWSVLGNDATSEQNDENNVANSTSGIVDTLSMDMEDIVVNKESHKQIAENSKYSVDIKNSVIEHKAKNDSACHELEGFAVNKKSNGTIDAGKDGIASAEKLATDYADGKWKDGSTDGNLEIIADDKKSKKLAAQEHSEHIAIDRKLDDAVADGEFEKTSSRKKSLDVTVCTKYEDAVVDKNSENSSNDKQKGEFDKSNADVPTDKKKEDIAIGKKMEEVTIVKGKEIPIDKKKEEVSIAKKKDVAVEKKKEKVPVDKKKEEVVIDKKMEDVAIEKKMEEVTIVKGKEIPIEKKKEEVSIAKKKDVAVEKKKEKIPLDKKKEEVVIDKIMEDVAIEKKMEEVSIDKKKEVAVENKKEKVPIDNKREKFFIDKKVEDVAIEKKVETVTIVKGKEIPIDKKKKEVFIDKKIEEVVIDNKMEEVTIVKKMEEIAIKNKTEEVAIVQKNEIVCIDKEEEKVATHEKKENVGFDQKAETENIQEQLEGVVIGKKSGKVRISSLADLSTDTKSRNFLIDKRVVGDVNSSNTIASSEEICHDKESPKTMTEIISTNVVIDRKGKDNSTHEKSRDAATTDQMCDNIQIHQESENSVIGKESENATIDKKLQNLDTTTKVSGATKDHKQEIISSDRESEDLVRDEKPEDSVLVKKIEDPVTDDKTKYSPIDKTRGALFTNSATSTISIDEKLQTPAYENDVKRPILEILPPLPPSPQLPPLPPLPPSPPPEESDISISPKSQHIKQDMDKSQVDKAVSRQAKNRPRIPCLPIVSLYSRKRRGLVLTDSASSHTVVRSVRESTADESPREKSKSPQISRSEPKIVLSLVKMKHTSKSSKIQLENPPNEPTVGESVNSVETWNICQSKCVDANSAGNAPFDASKSEMSADTNDKMCHDVPNATDESLPDSMDCKQRILVQSEVEDTAKKSEETRPEVQPKVDSQSIKTQRTSTSRSSTTSKSSERGKRSALKTIAPTVPSNDPGSSKRKRPVSKEKENQSKTGKPVPVMVIRRRRPVQLEDSSTVTTLVSSEHEEVNKDDNGISGRRDGPGRKRRTVET